nr:MAG TPA: receptor binding protein [Caudoviricetes sp.]
MAKIRKFIKGVYQYANLFKISNPPESVGDSEVKQVTPFRGIIQNQGDFITAEDHNEIQKNGVLFVSAEYSENHGTGVDAYVIKDYHNEQGLFDGLKLKFQIPKTNMYAAPVLVIDDLQYNLKIINDNLIENARIGELNKNEIVSVIYFNRNFVLENSRAGEKSYGITKYGTETGTTLEGNRLAEILGIEFGGNIQDVGNKTRGKFYYDSVTKYYYECIADTNLTYNDVSKFRAISNKPLSDKLEDLYEVIPGVLNANQIAGFSSATLYKKAGVVFLIIDDNQKLNGRTNGSLILTLPDGFRPRSKTSFSGNTSVGQACVFNVETDGRVILMSNIKLSGYLYFNVSFLAK